MLITSYLSVWGNTRECSNDKGGQPLWCGSPGTNLSKLIPTKTFPLQQRSHRHTPIIIIPRPREIPLLPPNTVKYCFEQKAQPAGPHALHTEPILALPRKWCNYTWAINLSPLCPSRLIALHTLGEQMTDDLQLKNKSTVTINCRSFTSGRDASLFLPCRRNTSISHIAHISRLPEITLSKGWQLVSACLEDTDPGSFFPVLLLAWRVLMCHGPHSRELKMSPQPWTILLCQDLSWGVEHMCSNPLRVQE